MTTPTPPVPVGPPNPPFIDPAGDDPYGSLKAHINNLSLPDLIAFTDDLQNRVDLIHTTVPPDSGAVSSNLDVSRIETALKLAKIARQIEETKATPLPAATAQVITDTIAILDQIDKAP